MTVAKTFIKNDGSEVETPMMKQYNTSIKELFTLNRKTLSLVEIYDDDCHIKKTDTIEEMNRKIAKVSRAAKGKVKQGWDPYKYLGKVKGVYGDGLEYQKKVRDEWER